MKKIRSNAKQILVELYNESDKSLSLREFVEVEADNDPGFYRWLFNDDLDCDFDSSLTEEEKAIAKEFISNI